MICNAYAVAHITGEQLFAMMEDAAHCNARLRRASYVPGVSDTQGQRLEREADMVVAKGADGFTRQDVMAWTGRNEASAAYLINRLIATKRIYRDGERNRAHLFRVTP